MIGFLLPAGALALAYGAVWTLRPVSWARSAIKTGSTVLLALAAAWHGLPILAMALGLGAVGDFFLSRDPKSGFLPGLAAFALGHAIYIAVLWPLAGSVPVVPVLVLASVSAVLLVRLWPVLGDLRLPVAIYAGLSVALGALALALPDAAVWITAGALAFIASDIVLAIELFLLPPESRWKPLFARGLWALYWLGQAAILWGMKTAASGIDAAPGFA